MNRNDTSETAHWAPMAAGGLAIISGLAILALAGQWFIFDVGWTGNGSGFRNTWQGLIPVMVAIAVAGLGVTALVTRNSGGRARPAFAAATAVAALVAPLALLAYPRIQGASLSARGTSGKPATWHTSLPVTEVSGMRSLTGDRLVIEGIQKRHRCQFVLRSMTIDVATGRVLDITQLPSWYPDSSKVPPAPTPLDPARFTVEQGSSPFICHS